MIHEIIKYLRISFPFLITVALWRLSCPWINPAGILAIIPIYYCSFIRPVDYFTGFAILMCFLIDYKFDTVLFWTSMYCIYYVIMHIQAFIDLAHTKKYGVYAFMLFFGVGVSLITVWNLTWLNFMMGVLMFTLVTIAYIPTTITVKTVGKYD